MAGRPTGEEERRLRRDIGPWLAVLVVVNATIGTGIFRVPAKVARLSGGLAPALGLWVVGAMVALCGAMTLAELAAAMPRAGGLYEYLRRAWHPAVGFLFGWTKLTLLIPSAVGSFAKLAAEATAAFFGLDPNPTRDSFFALALIVGCMAVNLLGVRTSVVQQGAVTLVKYLGVAFLAIVGLTFGVRHALTCNIESSPTFATTPTPSGLFLALVSVMWAYDGWADLASMAGEARNPSRTLPRALIAGTLAIAGVYLAANLGYARAIGLDGLRCSTTGSNMAAANLAYVTLGVAGRRILSSLILVSCVGGCMSSLMTGSRVFVPMAADRVFVGALGRVSARGVPWLAVVTSGLMGALYVLFRSFEQLTEAFVVGYFPFYTLGVGAVFVLRRREPQLERPFRVPLYPFVPIVFLVGAAVLMIGALGDADRTALLALGLLALGLPIGWLWRRYGKRMR
jgi:amino acid transporter